MGGKEKKKEKKERKPRRISNKEGEHTGQRWIERCPPSRGLARLKRWPAKTEVNRAKKQAPGLATLTVPASFQVTVVSTLVILRQLFAHLSHRIMEAGGRRVGGRG